MDCDRFPVYANGVCISPEAFIDQKDYSQSSPPQPGKETYTPHQSRIASSLLFQKCKTRTLLYQLGIAALFSPKHAG